MPSVSRITNKLTGRPPVNRPSRIHRIGRSGPAIVMPNYDAATFFLEGHAGTPNNIPRTLMSSSMSGQWAPSPLPMISKLVRCAGVASDSRQDHASGTLILRPSSSSAMIKSSVTFIVIIRGSLLTTVFIPALHNAIQIFEGQLSDMVKFVCLESIVCAKSYRFKPKLTCHSLTTHMNTFGFTAIEAVKEKSIRPRDVRNSWHSEISLGASIADRKLLIPFYTTESVVTTWGVLGITNHTLRPC